MTCDLVLPIREELLSSEFGCSVGINRPCISIQPHVLEIRFTAELSGHNQIHWNDGRNILSLRRWQIIPIEFL